MREGIRKWGEYLTWIFKYWKPVRKYIVLLILFTLVSSAVALGFPLVFRYLLDHVQTLLGTPDASGFNDVILVLGALAVARFVAGLYPCARGIINSAIGVLVRDDVFASIMRKDWRFFNRFRPGDLTTRLTDDITDYPRIAWFSCSAFFRALESTSRLLFCMGVMLFMSWQLTLLALAPLPVMLFIFYTVEHRLGRRVLASRKATSHTNDLLDSTFDGIAIVKAYRAEKVLAERLHRLLNQRFDIDFSLIRLEMIIHGLYSVIGQVGKVTVMLAGGLMVLRGRIGLGDFYAFYVYLDMLLAPMMDIPNLFVASRQAFVSIDREREIMDFPERRKSAEETVPLLVKTVSAHGAAFSYDGSGGLRELDFQIGSPEVVAVVGEVGSGKSTLLKMLAGLLVPESGAILVNGMDLSGMDISRSVGYVPQDSVLLGESIEENVRFGRDDISREQVERALAVAGIGRDELDLDTKVLGQRGVGASGGQRQRIAIARAIAGEPSLLLLDDCTAALDAAREEAFWRNLKSGETRPLTLVVTHREATVKQSDRVLFIHRGRLADAGEHAELLARNPDYARVILGMESEERKDA